MIVRDEKVDAGHLSSDGSRVQPDSVLRTTALLVAVIVLWLATRPYFGVVFDARFYMVEALRTLDPDRFAQDLYFKFGSQGNFSLFTKLYLPLLHASGVSTTALILTLACQLLWLFGLFRLARVLVGGQVMWLSIVVVVGMSGAYPGGFSYGENSLTARLLAEAFVLLGLAWLPTRPIAAFALLGLSAAFHPLMGLPGIALAFVYLALVRPIWWAVIAAGAGLPTVLGLVGIAPFSNLFRTIDPEWFAIIKIRSPQCLLGEWPSEYFGQVLAAVIWIVAAMLIADRSHRRFLAATLLVGIGGLACTFLGADIAHNMLVVEVQPWRSIWLLQMVSYIYAPLLFTRALARTSLDSFRWATLLTMALVLVSSVTRVIRNPTLADFTLVSLALMAASLAVMAAQLLLVDQKHRRILLIAALAAFALIPAALSQWDKRSPWIRYMESPEPPPKDLVALLPDGASVYWESGLEMLWLRMKRASYFSCDQGTGALFYRRTAMVYKERGANFWPLRVSDFSQLDTCASLDPRPKPERNRTGLHNLCIREPELDDVVLTTPLEGAEPKGIWKSPVHFQDLQSAAGKSHTRAVDRFYIYSCASLR